VAELVIALVLGHLADEFSAASVMDLFQYRVSADVPLQRVALEVFQAMMLSFANPEGPK
jgi:hypothetical protein